MLEIGISKNSLWVIDASTVAMVLAKALNRELGLPAYPFCPDNIPEEPSFILALVEILLPNSCGITIAAQLRSRTDAPVVVWGTQPIPLYAWVAWRIGLNGCLDKSYSWDDTVSLLQTLLDGNSVWPSVIWDRVRTFEQQMGWRLRNLTPTDWERWLDIIRGLQVKKLAEIWGLTLRGATKSVARLCEKLAVMDRDEIVNLAWSANMVKVGRETAWSEVVTLYQRLRSSFPSADSLVGVKK